MAEYRGGGRRAYLYGKNRKAAADRRREALKALQDGTAIEQSPMPLEEYLTDWLHSVEGTVRPRTHKRYEQLVRVHIVPEIGTTRMRNLRPRDLQDLYRRKIEGGLSPRSVQYVHLTLKKALKQALAWGMVNTNVAEVVTPPKVQGKEMRILSRGEVMRLFEAAKGDRFEALYTLAVTTGMRQGELLGLKWDDLDWEAACVGVKRTVYEGRSYPPKTRAGYRTIGLTSRALDSLREHMERSSHGVPHDGDDWVFSTCRGTPVRHNNLVRRSYKPLLQRAGLPPIPFHNLRHTAATLLLGKGVHPKLVQEMLGHATIAITLDTYLHVLPGMGDQVARAMEGVLGEGM